jgi:signal transduction histidine kinase
MKNIPFNVSARTARLIGRENVSSAEGALIELVKNSYDADAKNCIVFFDDEYVEIPESIPKDRFATYSNFLREQDLFFLSDFFKLDSAISEYFFQNDSFAQQYNADQRAIIEKKLQGSVAIHVVDDGLGMTQQVIEESWMTIGTDNKNVDFISAITGRVKSGAKGIGRFALDRLGEQCHMLTKTQSSADTLLWIVNWGDFDKSGATIDGISAQLGESVISLQQALQLLVNKNEALGAIANSTANGTHIRVTRSRDAWSRADIQQIWQELESLIPPAEAGDFRVWVYSSRYQDEFGEVLPNICDDFDYKLSASMNEAGIVNFELTRREIDPLKLSGDVLKRDFFLDPKYSLEKMTGRPFMFTKTLYELLPGLSDVDSAAHTSIGAFRLTLYFLKRASDKKDREVFLHRNFDSGLRKKWLDNNNGIRIFRDNFRVRPYGEIGKAAWDWLGLGRRQAEDPSSLRSGRWKVTPNNVSGVINISRISNLGLEDKSSREGIQENKAFILFKTLIAAMIKEFEQDRSGIYKEIYAAYIEKKNTPTDEELSERQEEDAEALARKIFEDVKKEPKPVVDDSTKLALALLKEKARAREADDRLEEMKKENSLLRVFASSGITIAAFTHELDSLNAKLGNRFDQLETIFRAYINMNSLERSTIADFKDPYIRIGMLKRDDERVKNWIKYSLRTIRKDKRKRVNLNISNYLENLRIEWLSTLVDRQIDIKIDGVRADLTLRAYEIDLDCVFNNLIINSADAFKRAGFSGERKITISAQAKKDKVSFLYHDTGPGLSKDIVDPTDIFKPTFTTKKNSLGEEIGTGLGMWLIEKTVDEYAGSAKLVDGAGFSLILEM